MGVMRYAKRISRWLMIEDYEVLHSSIHKFLAPYAVIILLFAFHQMTYRVVREPNWLLAVALSYAALLLVNSVLYRKLDRLEHMLLFQIFRIELSLIFISLIVHLAGDVTNSGGRHELHFLYIPWIIIPCLYFRPLVAALFMAEGAALYLLALVAANEPSGRLWQVYPLQLLAFLFVYLAMSVVWHYTKKHRLVLMSRSRELAMIEQLGSSLVALQFRDLVDNIAKFVCDTVDAETCAVFIYNTAGDCLVARSCYPHLFPEGVAEVFHLSDTQQRGLTGAVYLEDREIPVADVTKDSRANKVYVQKYIEALPSKKLHHFLGIPLRTDGKCFGVLRVMNKLVRDEVRLRNGFTDDDIHILRIVASLVSRAIVNVRALDHQVLVANLLSSMHDTDVKTLLTNVCNQMAEHLGVEYASILTYNSFRDCMEIRATNMGFEGFLGSEYYLHQTSERLGDDTEGQTGKVFYQRETIVVNNANQPGVRSGFKAAYYDRFEAKSQHGVYRHFMGVPLALEQRSIGVIRLINKQSGNKLDEFGFTDDDRAFVEEVSKSLAIAVDVAYKNEFQLDFVYEMVRWASDYERVRGEILQELLNRCLTEFNAERGSISLLNSSKTHLDIIAMIPEVKEARNISFPISPVESNIAAVAAARQPLLFADLGNPQQAGHYLEVWPESKSEVAAPLWRGTEVVGVINLERESNVLFTEADQSHLGVYAEYISHAISIEKLNRQLRDRTELLLNLPAILDQECHKDLGTVVNLVLYQVRERTNADWASLWLTDNRNSLCFVHGIGGDIGATPRSARISVRETFSGQVFSSETLKHRIIDDIEECSDRVRDELPDQHEYRSLISIPLWMRDGPKPKKIGVITLAFRARPTVSLHEDLLYHLGRFGSLVMTWSNLRRTSRLLSSINLVKRRTSTPEFMMSLLEVCKGMFYARCVVLAHYNRNTSLFDLFAVEGLSKESLQPAFDSQNDLLLLKSLQSNVGSLNLLDIDDSGFAGDSLIGSCRKSGLPANSVLCAPIMGTNGLYAVMLLIDKIRTDRAPEFGFFTVFDESALGLLLSITMEYSERTQPLMATREDND